MPRYCHEDPMTGKRHYYSASTCEMIATAKQMGQPYCGVEDVRLPDGRVLRFEIRFGFGLMSCKQNRPSPTGMVQVNVDSENTRVVYEEPDLPAPHGSKEILGVEQKRGEGGKWRQDTTTQCVAGVSGSGQQSPGGVHAGLPEASLV